MTTKFVFMAVVLAISAGVGWAGEAGDACTNLPDRPKVHECWDCFQELLLSCDDENQTPERRQACYEAANTFFTWCLGRTTAPGTPRPKPGHDDYSLNADREYDVREVLSLDFHAPLWLDADDVIVRLRDDDGERVLTSSNFWLFDNSFGSFTVVLDRFAVSGQSVGVLVEIRDRGEVVSGFAVALPMVDSFDLNHDGRFDQFDKIEAMNEYANGRLEYDRLIRIVSE